MASARGGQSLLIVVDDVRGDVVREVEDLEIACIFVGYLSEY
jgi:hypothetical protein